METASSLPLSDYSKCYKTCNDIPTEYGTWPLASHASDPDLVTSWREGVQLEVRGHGLLRLFSRDASPDDDFSLEIAVRALSVPLSINLPEREGSAVMGIWRLGDVHLKLNGINHSSVDKGNDEDVSTAVKETLTEDNPQFKKGHRRNDSSFLSVSGAPDVHINSLSAPTANIDTDKCEQTKGDMEGNSYRLSCDRRLEFLRENSAELLDSDYSLSDSEDTLVNSMVHNEMFEDAENNNRAGPCDISADEQYFSEMNINVNDKADVLSNTTDSRHSSASCQSRCNDGKVIDFSRPRCPDKENNFERIYERTQTAKCTKCGRDTSSSVSTIRNADSSPGCTSVTSTCHEISQDTNTDTDTTVKRPACTRVRLDVPIRRSFTELLYMCDMMDFCDHLYENEILDIVTYRTLYEMSVEPVHRKDAKRKLLLYLSTREVQKADMIKSLNGSAHYQFIPNFFPEEK